jgi:hypothetical protein
VTETVIFPVIESLVIAYLEAHIPERVAAEVPADRTPSASFVKVERVGGPRRDRVTDAPMVVVQCWAPSKAEAARLGARVQAYVYALEQTNTPHGYVRAVREVAGLQSFPDPVSGAACYQFTAQLQTKGVPL